MTTIQLSPSDSVAVALTPLNAGERVAAGSITVTAASSDIAAGHKIALHDMAAGEDVIKYGCVIGHASEPIPAGAWVHSHNLATNLGANLEYSYAPRDGARTQVQSTKTFPGFRRRNGEVGVRNSLFIVPTVGCINGAVESVARQFEQVHQGFGAFDGVIVAGHPYGCSQLGGDLDATRRLLQDIIAHPNAGGVLVMGLGCENNQLGELRAGLGDCDESRVKFLIAQQSDDEIGDALNLLEELNEAATDDERTDVPLSALRVGLKCGGSDGFSGITANPLLGRFSDYLVSQGGTAVLTEVPEMFGAEQVLMSRAADEAVFNGIVAMVNDFKDYFRRYGQPIYDNPSPGNKEGGITTLEEKSLGATQKGGTSPVVDVLDYGGRIRRPGLSLLQAPGNDLVSSTALAAAGCQIVLFTTGRGTPFGTIVPTIKVSTNTALAQRKSGWIDFDAGALLDESMDDVTARFADFVLAIAAGQPARNEVNRMQQIAIFKDGVTE